MEIGVACAHSVVHVLRRETRSPDSRFATFSQRHLVLSIGRVRSSEKRRSPAVTTAHACCTIALPLRLIPLTVFHPGRPTTSSASATSAHLPSTRPRLSLRSIELPKQALGLHHKLIFSPTRPSVSRSEYAPRSSELLLLLTRARERAASSSSKPRKAKGNLAASQTFRPDETSDDAVIDPFLSAAASPPSLHGLPHRLLACARSAKISQRT